MKTSAMSQRKAASQATCRKSVMKNGKWEAIDRQRPFGAGQEGWDKGKSN
jgi:hypothetical protein